MTQADISPARIDQIREEGKQAARHGLPFSANPHSYRSQESKEWEHGFISGMRPEEEVE